MPIPQGTERFLAQADVVRAVQDHAPFQPCVRLVGVTEDSWQDAAFNTETGCATFLIDLDVDDLWRGLGAGDAGVLPAGALADLNCFTGFFEHEEPDLWFDIRFSAAASGQVTPTYAYELFLAEEPAYLEVRSVSLVRGPAVQPASTGTLPAPPQAVPNADWELTAFHVGQGMCSLLQERAGTCGYLLDAGAGTPVRRADYLLHRAGRLSPFVNELMSPARVQGLNWMPVILSHPDSDHWRLLDWDSSLLAMAQQVFLPAGQPALAFSSVHIKPKVHGLAGGVQRFNGSNRLEVLRSQPAHSDRNGECLVALVTCDRAEALVAGDYVYDRMATDSVATIRSAASAAYDAVIVPHHGDAASARSVPPAFTRSVSKAFFSAGNHAGYGHPTQQSLTAHQAQGYALVNRQPPYADLRERPLIP